MPRLFTLVGSSWQYLWFRAVRVWFWAVSYMYLCIYFLENFSSFNYAAPAMIDIDTTLACKYMRKTNS